MPPINRLTQSNGRTPLLEDVNPVDVQPSVQATAMSELKKVLQERPGTLLLIGLVAGGLIGWLTSNRSR